MAGTRLLVDEPAATDGPLRSILLILWHGAGGDIDQPSLVSVAEAFANQGALAVRARFPYRVAGRRAPDRMPVLMQSARAAIEEAGRRCGATDRKLFLGGRSMGGRVASLLVAEGVTAAGLLLLSYPLHPARQPEKLRDAHLPECPCPMLFVQGDRDPLCALERLKPVLYRIGPRASLSVFPGADHSFRRVPPEEVARLAVEWARSVAVAG